MNDYVIGHIRTYVPILVGAIVAWLISLGLDINPETEAGIIVALTGLLQAVYYTLVRFLATKWPWFGNLLGVNETPAYREAA